MNEIGTKQTHGPFPLSLRLNKKYLSRKAVTGINKNLNLAGCSSSLVTTIGIGLLRIGLLLLAGCLGIGAGDDGLLILLLHVPHTYVIEAVDLADRLIQDGHEFLRCLRRLEDVFRLGDDGERLIHRVERRTHLGRRLGRLKPLRTGALLGTQVVFPVERSQLLNNGRQVHRRQVRLRLLHVEVHQEAVDSHRLLLRGHALEPRIRADDRHQGLSRRGLLLDRQAGAAADALEKERHERIALQLQLIEHLRQVVAYREINSFVKLVHFRRELPELLVRDAKDVSCFKKG